MVVQIFDLGIQKRSRLAENHHEHPGKSRIPLFGIMIQEKALLKRQKKRKMLVSMTMAANINLKLFSKL